MDEVKLLLDNWKEDGFVNPDALQVAYNAMIILVDKIESLEAEVENLKNGQV
jgi:hypothetical protein